MITTHKGNAKTPGTFRLILTCEQCHLDSEVDVPLHNIRDHGEVATEPYLECARGELAKTCPHMQEELARQANHAPSSQSGTWSSQRRSFYNGSV